MKMTQGEVIGRLQKRGFSRGHRPLRDGSVVMSKRVNPWHQVFAQIGLDGLINGGDTVSAFLTGLSPAR